MNIDDEINSTRILNERHARDDAFHDLAGNIYNELMAVAMKDVNGPVSFDDRRITHYDLPLVHDRFQSSRRPATALEVLTADDKLVAVAVKTLILCARKGDVDAMCGLKEMVSTAADDIAQDKEY